MHPFFFVLSSLLFLAFALFISTTKFKLFTRKVWRRKRTTTTLNSNTVYFNSRKIINIYKYFSTRKLNILLILFLSLLWGKASFHSFCFWFCTWRQEGRLKTVLEKNYWSSQFTLSEIKFVNSNPNGSAYKFAYIILF